VSATPTRVDAPSVAMDRRQADITPVLAMPGSRKETRMESQRRRRAGAEEPKRKMERAYIKVLMEKIVTIRLITMVVIERLKVSLRRSISQTGVDVDHSRR